MTIFPSATLTGCKKSLKARRANSIGKSKATLFDNTNSKVNVTFKDVAGLEGAKEEITENDLIFDQWSLNLVNIMNQEGVKIIAGTDTPIGYLTPGYSLHKELELLFEAGMTAKEVLRSATITPAEFLNIENKIGTIDEGKLADLLILNQNPLESIKNTQDIHLVIAKGVIQ